MSQKYHAIYVFIVITLGWVAYGNYKLVHPSAKETRIYATELKNKIITLEDFSGLEIKTSAGNCVMVFYSGKDYYPQVYLWDEKVGGWRFVDDWYETMKKDKPELIEFMKKNPGIPVPRKGV